MYVCMYVCVNSMLHIANLNPVVRIISDNYETLFRESNSMHLSCNTPIISRCLQPDDFIYKGESAATQ